MNNIGAHIIQEQNTDSNIKYLASQKKIYNTGKLAFTIQVLIAVPIPIVISIIVPLLKNAEYNITWIFILYSILATFLELYLEGKTCELKKRAASIQELFDSKVLLIDWNSTLIPKPPEPEVVFRYYNKFVKKNTLEKLYDWYPKEIESVKTNVATLICQRINCNYDFTLRKRYSNSILILALITSIILFVISGIFGLTITSFITNVLFPSLPVFVLAYKQIANNKEAIKNLNELKNLIESELRKVKITDCIDNFLIRQIQDKIYLKRINSPLVPEWAYNLLRQNLEDEMHFSVSENIRELSEHSNKLKNDL